MGWRFRKSFKLMPGIRLNVSPRGISTSIGGAPFTVNLSSRGVATTVGIPGTGLSFRHHEPAHASRAPHSRSRALSGAGEQETNVGPSPSLPPRPMPPGALGIHGDMLPALDPAATEIRSAGSEQITSAGLAEFRRVLQEADREYHELETTLPGVQRRAHDQRAAVNRWARGFLLKHLRKGRFAAMQMAADEAEAELAELREQQRLTRLATQIDLPTEFTEVFHRLRDAFAATTSAAAVWDMLSQRETDRVRERTSASQTVTRAPVQFCLGGSDLLETEWRVPHLQNRNGGDLFLYPAFVLYRVSRDAFAVINIADLDLQYAHVNFIERAPVPRDAAVVGQTWFKCNKDGSPDRRFRDNFQIPLVRYGELTFRSAGGLHEQYHVSNAAAAESFVRAWQSYHALVRSQRTS